MDEHDEPTEGRDEDGPLDVPADEPDPESAPAGDPPPGQEPGDGKQHDL